MPVVSGLKTNMVLKILATADVHIGRRPSKLSDSADAGRFSCARIWAAIVDRAIQETVDLVVLTGDLVDHDNRFFEATGPLENGLTRLAAAEIPVFAVAGNHDSDVLPRIADAVGRDRFRLLGRGGRWEEAVLERDGRPVLRLHGWSFPSDRFESSPLADYDLPLQSSVPTVGLLHGDLDAHPSYYAPVRRSELESRGVAIWILGHVHRPTFHRAASAAAILYPGSPQAMDPGETGRHGPWLIEIHGPHRVEAKLLPMSKVRYEELEVDLTDVRTEADFEARVVAQTSEYVASIGAEGGPLEHLSLRLVFSGRTALCSRVDDLSRSLEEEFEPRAESVVARIDRVTNDTLPAVDLGQLAANHDPPGVLARTLLALESGQPDESLTELIRATRQKMLEVHNASAYGSIRDGGSPDVEAARGRLIRQGRLLLDRLLAQERSA